MISSAFLGVFHGFVPFVLFVAFVVSHIRVNPRESVSERQLSVGICANRRNLQMKTGCQSSEKGADFSLDAEYRRPYYVHVTLGVAI